MEFMKNLKKGALSKKWTMRDSWKKMRQKRNFNEDIFKNSPEKICNRASDLSQMPKWRIIGRQSYTYKHLHYARHRKSKIISKVFSFSLPI